MTHTLLISWDSHTGTTTSRQSRVMENALLVSEVRGQNGQIWWRPYKGNRNLNHHQVIKKVCRASSLMLAGSASEWMNPVMRQYYIKVIKLLVPWCPCPVNHRRSAGFRSSGSVCSTLSSFKCQTLCIVYFQSVFGSYDAQQ